MIVFRSSAKAIASFNAIHLQNLFKIYFRRHPSNGYSPMERYIPSSKNYASKNVLTKISVKLVSIYLLK